MIKIWGRASSVNVQKVLWAADEVGLTYERVDVGGAFGGLDTPEFERLNPARLIPALQDGDFVLAESNAIVRYLAEKYGAGTLAPPSLEERASAQQWCEWGQYSLYRDIISNCFHQLIRVTADQRNHALLKASAARAGDHLATLDRHLAGRSYIMGSEFTFADIIVGCMTHRYFTMEIVRPTLPNVEAWYQRLSTRPPFRKHVMVDWTAMKIPGA